jgi:diacylglycerol kinase
MGMILKRVLKSLKYAFRGWWYVFKHEENFRIQMFVAFFVAIAAIYFPLSKQERIIVIFMIFFVLLMEMINTALEYLIDLLKPRLHHYVSLVKDIMAGAVLLTAFCAVILGLFIFFHFYGSWWF